MGNRRIVSLLSGASALVVLGLAFLCGCTPQTGGALKASPPRVYVCHQLQGTIVLDGKIDEPAWQKAQPLWAFSRYFNPYHPPHHPYYQYRDSKPGLAVSRTRARMLWDDRHLYIAAEMDDKDLYAVLTDHDAATWKNDVFEIFLRPNPDAYEYYELHVTPNNTTMDSRIPRRRARGWGDCKAFESGMKTAAQARGTLNDHGDQDGGWSVEMRIPFSGLPILQGRKPVIGDQWGFAACRYDYSVHLPTDYFNGRELSSSARGLAVQGFHHLEQYDHMRFEK